MPPRLPPRAPVEGHLSPSVAYIPDSNSPYSHPSGIDDPRTSSTQSLRPVESPGGSKRKLLLIYIHGFLGAEASFKSFPAHVHTLLTISLAESHVIHTKIYPRYHSRKNISFTRDNFSNWLYPHESPDTDVVLLGHSLGGILAAEVVLIPCHVPGSNELFQHRILGQVAFDTPFLGMHPGVVSTGIASLFKGAPEESGPVQNLDQSEVLNSSSSDPNYNPAYANDVTIPVRKNKWERAWYFWNKHADNLGKAAKSYVMSHFEFGGCLADYPGLRRRYEAVRSLEDINELHGIRGPNGKLLKRVRFVNYYTASTGRIKQPRPKEQGQLIAQTEMQTLTHKSNDSLDVAKSASTTPRLSLSEHRDSDIVDKTSELTLDHRADSAVADDISPSEADTQNASTVGNVSQQDQTEQQVEQSADVKRQATLNTEQYDKHLRSESHEQTKGKRKDRKFCTLPSKNPKTGARDSTWVRVYMEGMDEVVAHCSLFDPSETYAKLVGDTAERITEWLQEDATNRALLHETTITK